MNRFSGKTVVITGAASGIGRETAIRFAEEGANVVIGDLNVEGGQETVRLCSPGKALFQRTDVTIEGDIESLIELARSDMGGLDVLVNNAGFGGAMGPISDVTSDAWDRTFQVIVRSVFLGMKYASPHLKAQKNGAIISTASIAGFGGFPFGHAYCAAKAAIINLTRSAAIELGPHGVRVNCVCPGDIVTPMLGADLSVFEEPLSKRQPIGRAGRPRDVASAIMFLASDNADWIAGEALVVDGGATAGIWTYGEESRPENAIPAGFRGPSFEQSAA